MHGIIFANLYKFIRDNHGHEVLDKIKNDAGISTAFYDATKSHPDSEIIDLVVSASKILKTDVDVLLEAFGNYIAPGLLKTYAAFMKPEWDCLDLLEHVESSMHKAVRKSVTDSAPPVLKVKRLGKDQILIEYSSKRNMIALGIGIIKALGTHYNEKLRIDKKVEPTKVLLTVSRIK